MFVSNIQGMCSLKRPSKMYYIPVVSGSIAVFLKTFITVEMLVMSNFNALV